MLRFLRRLFGSKPTRPAASEPALPDGAPRGNTASTTDDHWARIEAARATANGDHSAMAEALRELLLGCPAETIASFDAWLHAQRARANRWDLWGAAYVMNGGCSDDGFIDFRNGLIAQGRVTFEAALADPEALAELELALDAEDGLFFESLGYVAPEAYEQRTGGELEGPVPNDAVQGEPWDEADLPRLFPRLTARYGG